MLAALSFAGVAFGATMLGIHWLTSSPRFALDSLEIEGNQMRSAADIEARLGPLRGQNLFRLELAELEARLAGDPWIAAAKVKRRLPRGLTVAVEEHRAAAVVELGGLYLASEDGSVFARANPHRGDTVGLPIVTGLSREEYRKRPTSAAAEIRRALQIVRAWNAAEERPALGEVRLEKHRGITVYTYEGAVAVHLGRTGPEEMERRLAAFDTAYAALSAEERAAATSFFIGRGRAPERVTVALGDWPGSGSEHAWAK